MILGIMLLMAGVVFVWGGVVNRSPFTAMSQFLRGEQGAFAK